MERRHFLQLMPAAVVTVGVADDEFEESNPDDLNVKDAILLEAPRQPEICLTGREYSLMESAARKLKGVRKTVGYGHFNLVGFDDVVSIARNHGGNEPFTETEKLFLEQMFYEDAGRYGFFGAKALTNLTDTVAKRETVKIPYTGHYLYRGDSERMYSQICKELGESVVLTSGVRGIGKQMQLFLAKALRVKGNLSVASRSLAPPGYSFHGVGDFDVGKRGYGYRNFTADFAKTDEYKRLMDLGYISIRYFDGNPFGVRFEPWHIKVVAG